MENKKRRKPNIHDHHKTERKKKHSTNVTARHSTTPANRTKTVKTDMTVALFQNQKKKNNKNSL